MTSVWSMSVVRVITQGCSDAPRELNIARSTTEENPARKKETYYAEPGISKEAQQEIKRILWNERMKAEAKKLEMPPH